MGDLYILNIYNLVESDKLVFFISYIFVFNLGCTVQRKSEPDHRCIIHVTPPLSWLTRVLERHKIKNLKLHFFNLQSIEKKFFA